MSAIGPGDWVECVDCIPSDKPTAKFALGSIYQVEDCVFVPGIKQPHGLIIKEMPRSSHPTGAYCATAFRPIYRPKAGLIESLKTPAKREGVPA